MYKLKFLFLVIVSIQCFNLISQSTDREIDRQVKQILKSMTLEEKCGEMTQLTLDALMVGEAYNIPEPQIQDYAVNKKKNGIPVLYGVDAIHGTTYTKGGILFPQQIGQAATWNPELVKQAASVTAYETKASGIPWNFSPVLDIGRNKLWPRLWETFGEDVYLAKKMGVAALQGYQGEDNDISNPYKLVACLKHFFGYSDPKSGRDRTPVYIPLRQLYEYHLPTFKAAVDNGAQTVMINSGEINGIPVHTSKFILTQVLRDELGFEGIALTDWEDIRYLFTRHKTALDHKDAIRQAINAGIDMSMVPLDTEFPFLLKELVLEGKVKMRRINEAVSRILKVKIKAGLFDDYNFYKNNDYSNFGSEEHRKIAENAALESITLLKNENATLPLSRDKRLLVCGPTSNSINALNGGWSHTWQGDDPKQVTPGKLSIYEALAKDFQRVDFALGTSFDAAQNIAYAKQLAQNADAIVVCLGEMPYTEFVGNIDDLNLPQCQYDLVNALAETGKPITLVLVEGRPRIIRQIEDKVDAVVMAYLPGNEGGPALSKILSGAVNPSGKLPYTYPQSCNDMQTYDHKYTEGLHTDFSMNAFRPQFEFGAGLSYTNFSYSNLKLGKADYFKSEKIGISVDVENTGSTTGKEVIQLYVSDLVASITPSVKRLRGFVKVELQPGDIATVKFNLNPYDLAFVDKDLNWTVESGEFEIEIAGLKEKFTLR